MKKIFQTILMMFLIVVISSFPTITKKNVVRTNFEIQKQEVPTTPIYLLNKENYLVEVEIVIPENKKTETILEYLKKGTGKWSGYIPKEVEIIKEKQKNGLLEIHFSKEAEKIKKEYLGGIIETFLKQPTIEKVELYIEEEKIESIPSINLEKENLSRKDTEKIVIYYIEDIKDNHLVPITRYLETNNEKMNGILEELKNHTPKGLISYVTDSLKVINYQIDKDIMTINMNQVLIEDPEKKNWLMKEIAYSIMKNYEVNAVLFQVEGKQEELILK